MIKSLITITKSNATTNLLWFTNFVAIVSAECSPQSSSTPYNMASLTLEGPINQIAKYFGNKHN